MQAIHLAAQTGDLDVVGVLIQADNTVLNATIVDTRPNPYCGNTRFMSQRAPGTLL